MGMVRADSSGPGHAATAGVLVGAAVLGVFASVGRDARYTDNAISGAFWFFAAGGLVCAGYGFSRIAYNRSFAWTLAAMCVVVMARVFWPSPSIEFMRNSPREAFRQRSAPVYVFGPLVVGGLLGLAISVVARLTGPGGALAAGGEAPALCEADIETLRARVLSVEMSAALRAQLEHSDPGTSECWTPFRARLARDPSWTPRSAADLRE